MSVDCQWTEQNLEGYFCERLPPEEDRKMRAHLETCLPCLQKVEGLRRIDPLIKKLFQQNLALARLPLRHRSPVLIGGVAASAVAAILLAVFLVPEQISGPPSPPPATFSSTAPQQAPVPKVPDASGVERTKPSVVASDQPGQVAIRPPQMAPGEKAPEFLVTDPAGYSRTLNDYRNYVLVFALWSSDQPQTISNLERVYQEFGTNTRLRILGIVNVRTPKPANTTFPMAYNQSSTLLGAKTGEFYVVDGNGAVRLRGSLLQDTNNLLNSVRTTLNELGIQ